MPLRGFIGIMTYKITLDRNSLGFAAAHFATFAGGCESLHGHNYALSVEIAGHLTEDSWVLDFSDGKRIVRNICKELEHKLLLQTESRVLKITEGEEQYEIVFENRRYVVPKADVAPLAIDNTTAECLAEWFAGCISDALASEGASNLSRITVGVEEAPGQAGWYTLLLTEQAKTL